MLLGIFPRYVPAFVNIKTAGSYFFCGLNGSFAKISSRNKIPLYGSFYFLFSKQVKGGECMTSLKTRHPLNIDRSSYNKEF